MPTVSKEYINYIANKPEVREKARQVFQLLQESSISIEETLAIHSLIGYCMREALKIEGITLAP